MKRYAVVCGLLRFPLETALTFRRLFQLRADGLLDGIVLSTWTPEVERELDFVAWARREGVTVIHALEHPDKGPTMLYTQARAVWLGLQAVPEDADVLKLRTDKTTEMLTSFVPLLSEGTSGAAFTPGLHGATRRKQAVLWPHVGRPFYFGDQAHFGTRQDLLASLNFDARYHLNMEGLNPEAKWWMRPSCERFPFWREFFQGTEQMVLPDTLRRLLPLPLSGHVPDVVFDVLATTLRMMTDGFLFTVKTPLRNDRDIPLPSYSELLRPTAVGGTYLAASAGRQTVSLRTGASLDCLISGRVPDCSMSDGMKAALLRRKDGPPSSFDQASLYHWMSALEGEASARSALPRLFQIQTASSGGSERGGVDTAVQMAARVLATEDKQAAEKLLERLDAHLKQQLPVARAMFRAALDLERLGFDEAMVNSVITTAAQQKNNEASLEYALRALEGGKGTSMGLAEKLLAPACARGIGVAHYLLGLLLRQRLGPDATQAAQSFAEAARVGSPDVVYMQGAEARASQDDAAALRTFAESRGFAGPVAIDFARRTERLRKAGVMSMNRMPGSAG